MVGYCAGKELNGDFRRRICSYDAFWKLDWREEQKKEHEEFLACC